MPEALGRPEGKGLTYSGIQRNLYPVLKHIKASETDSVYQRSSFPEGATDEGTELRLLKQKSKVSLPKTENPIPDEPTKN